MKLFSIEGNTQWLDGGSMYGNAPKVMWSRWSPADERNRILLSCRALLVQTTEGRNILFEAGIGAFFEPKLKERYGVVETEHMLIKNLNAIGIQENDIDAIVLSHLHFDHVGGLLSAYGEPLRLLFQKAKYYVSKRHWERAISPPLRERASFIPQINELLKRSERLVFIENNRHQDMPSNFLFRFSDGHTLGLMMSEILTDTGTLVFVSDLIPGMPWLHLPITMGYDRHPELVVEEKKALLTELTNLHGSVFFTHDHAVACANITQESSDKFIGTPITLK